MLEAGCEYAFFIILAMWTDTIMQDLELFVKMAIAWMRLS